MRNSREPRQQDYFFFVAFLAAGLALVDFFAAAFLAAAMRLISVLFQRHPDAEFTNKEPARHRHPNRGHRRLNKSLGRVAEPAPGNSKPRHHSPSDPPNPPDHTPLRAM